MLTVRGRVSTLNDIHLHYCHIHNLIFSTPPSPTRQAHRTSPRSAGRSHSWQALSTSMESTSCRGFRRCRLACRCVASRTIRIDWVIVINRKPHEQNYHSALFSSPAFMLVFFILCFVLFCFVLFCFVLFCWVWFCCVCFGLFWFVFAFRHMLVSHGVSPFFSYRL
jgi:hypothetical protein